MQLMLLRPTTNAPTVHSTPQGLFLKAQCRWSGFWIGKRGRIERDCSRKRTSSTNRISAKKQTYTQVESVPVEPVSPALPPNNGSMNWLLPLAALVLGALLYNPVRKQLRPAVMDSVDDDTAYRRAVARTRQSIYVHRAIAFMNTNAPARVIVELERALKENAICRSELLIAQHSQEELQGLYKAHLRNEEVPPEYATLLQLREMLGISTETADKIEKDIFKTDSFVI